MVPSLRTLLLGRDRSRFQFRLDLLFVALAFALTFAAYALGIFRIEGGVVFLPGDAALLGLTAAVTFAYQRHGLVLSWLTVYAALLGYSADHYLLGLSGRSLGERLGAFLSLDGLVYLGVAALVLGTLAWGVGALVRWSVELLRDEGASASA
jgi:hypothetical protein